MTHRIRRQILELELPREAGAVALQRQAGRVFQEKVLPRLDELFSQIAPADRIVRLDRLEIDLGSIGETNWERNFVERCVEQISRQVTESVAKAEIAPDEDSRVLNPEENALAVFLFFLETGALPWYARGMGLKTLENLILQAAADRPAGLQQVLQSVLRRKEAVLRRLLWQFSPGFPEKMLDVTLGFASGGVEQILQTYQSRTTRPLTPDQRHELFKNLLEGVAPDQSYMNAQGGDTALPSSSLVRKPETESASSAAVPPKPGRPAPDKPSEKLTKSGLEDEGIMIDNAGIVLLGPYLPAFFQELGLTQAGTFISPDKQYRAIHLLHFLATGLEQPEEPVLVLPKLLCGMPLEDPVPLDIELSEAEQNESEDLLKAVIQNWPALKNTSPDGLRNGFLQRSGLLSQLKNQPAWLLRPERLGQDMLLERLPWGIAVIKLPWMETMIRIEW
jgi:hypothetical protein